MADEGWGRRLLDEQRPDGQWGRWRNTPVLVDEPVHPPLTCVILAWIPKTDRTRHAIELVHSNVTWGPWHGDLSVFRGGGRALHQWARRGPRHLLWEAEPPIGGPSAERAASEMVGGTVRRNAGSVRSSFHTTICVLEGLLAHEAVLRGRSGHPRKPASVVKSIC